MPCVPVCPPALLVACAAVAWEWLPVCMPLGSEWYRAGHSAVVCRRQGQLGVAMFGGVDRAGDKCRDLGFLPLTPPSTGTAGALSA